MWSQSSPGSIRSHTHGERSDGVSRWRYHTGQDGVFERGPEGCPAHLPHSRHAQPGDPGSRMCRDQPVLLKMSRGVSMTCTFGGNASRLGVDDDWGDCGPHLGSGLGYAEIWWRDGRNSSCLIWEGFESVWWPVLGFVNFCAAKWQVCTFLKFSLRR